MASLQSRRGGKSWYIQFEDRNRARRTITLGKIPQRAAQQTLIHVEKLAAAQIAGTAPDPDTSRWLAAASEKLTAKLSRAGLIETRQNATLGAFIDAYDEGREADPKIKATTIAASRSTYKSLRSYFGESRPLRAISKGEAKAWRVSVSKGRAENTVRKWTAAAKKLFNAAIEHELIEVNPFVGLPSSTMEVRERDYFLSPEDASKVLATCPSIEWKLIFALARYGGLRCPSEVLSLRWGDVLWDHKRIIVNSPKTEHHDGHDSRVIPLWPELEQLLAEAFEAAPEGAEFVVSKTRDTAANLRTTMQKIVQRAGLRPWPKIFQNLRSTRATELADRFPDYVAAAWIGHSVKVARRSYWQITDDHFEEATGESAANALQKVLARDGKALPLGEAEPTIAAACDLLQLLSTCTVGDEGLEPPTSTV